MDSATHGPPAIPFLPNTGLGRANPWMGHYCCIMRYLFHTAILLGVFAIYSPTVRSQETAPVDKPEVTAGTTNESAPQAAPAKQEAAKQEKSVEAPARSSKPVELEAVKVPEDKTAIP